MYTDIRFPHITETTKEGQIRQIRSYLWTLADQLQRTFSAIDDGATQSPANSPAVKQEVEMPSVDAVVERGRSGLWTYRN